MAEFIRQYWLEVIFGGVVSGLSLAMQKIWRGIKTEKKEQDAVKAAVLALLHDRLYSLARYYIDREWITVQDLDNLEYLFNAYHALGGNGTGTELFNRCKSLPIRPLNIANALTNEEE